MTILFTCSGRRNYLISYFKEALGTKGKTIAIDNKATAPTLQVADVGIVVPSISSCDYIPTLKKIIAKYNVNALIPLNDLELPLLAKHKLSIESLGVIVFISSNHLIDTTLDKWKSYKFIKSLNINTPKTFLRLNDALTSIKAKKIKFPLVVKPRWGSGSLEIHFVNSIEELKLAYTLLKLKKQTLTLQLLNLENQEEFIIIQECVKGQEYGMDVLNDLNGKFISSFARKKIAMRSGETDKAMTIIESEMTKLGRQIGNATQHIGILDCDFFIDENKLTVIELNPRFGGGYPFSHNAGINIPAIYLSWLNKDNNISKYLNYQANLIFSKYDTIMHIKVVK